MTPGKHSVGATEVDPLTHTFGEYADGYLADLLAPLPDADARFITQTLAMSHVGGPFPDREAVQRSIERHLGVITDQQHLAWVLDRAVGQARDDGDGIAHILDRLAEGTTVGGTRRRALWLLAGMDDTLGLLRRVRDAVERAVLTRAEARDILSEVLRNTPLPPLVPQPDRLAPLPEPWPPATSNDGCLAVPDSTMVRGFATMEALRKRAAIRTRMADGELDRETGLRMIEELITEFAAGPMPEQRESAATALPFETRTLSPGLRMRREAEKPG